MRIAHPIPALLAGAALRLACGAWWLAAAQTHAQSYAGEFEIRRDARAAEAARTGRVTVWTDGTRESAAGWQVLRADGTAVGHAVLWAADGHPVELLFDCAAGDAAYRVRFSEGRLPPPPAWKPEGGVVLESRAWLREGDGVPEDIRGLWSASTSVLGRSLVQGVHLGVDPHAPAPDKLFRFAGRLQAATEGTYGFAVMADDPAWVFVNGALVAAYRGWGGVTSGQRGQHAGTCGLGAGSHTVEVFNAQRGAGFSVTLAWTPPGATHATPVPVEAWHSIAAYRAATFRSAAGRIDDAFFGWTLPRHVRLDEHALVDVELHILAGDRKAEWEWSFEDGAVYRGARATHTFVRRGTHTVRARVVSGSRAGVVHERTIAVEPHFGQRIEWPPEVFDAQRKRLLDRGMEGMPDADLRAGLALFRGIADRDLLSHFGAEFLRRAERLAAADAATLLGLAFHFQHASVRDYDRAQSAFRQALRLADDVALRARAGLHYGGFLIHCRQQAREGVAALPPNDMPELSGEERRMGAIFRADAELAQGRRAEAHAAYAAAGTAVDPLDRAAAVRRRARLETARDYLARGEYDEADRIVREIEWEAPLERMNLETGLILIGVHLGRKEFAFAAAHARRLLAADPADARRPEVWYALGQAAEGAGDRATVREALERLQQDHPYVEVTIRARESWPGLR